MGDMERRGANRGRRFQHRDSAIKRDLEATDRPVVTGYLPAVEFTDLGTNHLLRLSGEIDDANAQELERRIADRVDGHSDAVVIDLTGVDYLDSTGVDLFFNLAERLRDRRRALRIVVPEDAPIRRVIELSDLASVAAIEPRVPSADAW